MTQLRPRARLYIWTVIALGPAAVAAAWWLERARPPDARGWLSIFFGCLLVAVASRGKVTLFRAVDAEGGEGGGRATMTLGYVPTFLILFSMGPLAGVLAGIANVAAQSRRSRPYKTLFSASALALSALAAVLALRPFGLAPGDWDPVGWARAGRAAAVVAPVIGILLAATVHYLVNTGLVTAAIALSSGQSPIRMWSRQLLWAAPVHYAGASCAAIVLAILPYLGKLSQVPNAATYAALLFAVFVVAVPIPTVIFFAYKYHAQRDEANRERIEALGKSAEELRKSAEELALKNAELQSLFTSTVESLALAIDAKDRYTKEHIQRVKEVAVAIAAQMGLNGDDLKAVETGALLHDIGKLAVPEHILTKPGRLSDDEYTKMKAHPDMGARILEPVPFPFPVLPVVRSHHERWDGRGYPDGLAGEAIPLGGRILAVADVYDALTSDRSYREGWSHERAVTHLREQAGTHFDPRVIEAFLAVLEARPDLHACGGGATAAAVSAKEDVGSAATAERINRASFEALAEFEVARVAAATLDLSETLSLLAGRAREVFGATVCAVLLRDDGGEGPAARLRVRHADGEGKDRFEGAAAMPGDAATGTTASVVAARRGALASFRPDDLEWPGDGETGADDPLLRSALIAPLIAADGAVIGTINLYHKKPDAFDAEDLRVLEAVAAPAARALRNAAEYERTLESALTDSLTGLRNARHLDRFLEQELRRLRESGGTDGAGAGTGRVLTLLVLDLDDFKPVNDRFGHARGNEVLRDLGRAFQATLRAGDLVARYAGDEFVVVLPGAGPDEACVVIEKLRAAVRAYDPTPAGASDEARVALGVSIGAASYPLDGIDAASLIAAADRAMYRDKRARKGGGSGGEISGEKEAPAPTLAEIGGLRLVG